MWNSHMISDVWWNREFSSSPDIISIESAEIFTFQHLKKTRGLCNPNIASCFRRNETWKQKSVRGAITTSQLRNIIFKSRDEVLDTTCLLYCLTSCRGSMLSKYRRQLVKKTLENKWQDVSQVLQKCLGFLDGNHAINEQPMYSSILRRSSDNLFRKKILFRSIWLSSCSRFFTVGRLHGFHGWPCLSSKYMGKVVWVSK